MWVLRVIMLALALVAGQAAAQTATSLPPFPPAMDLPETPWVAPTRALYQQLMAPNWTPTHELTGRPPRFRGRLFCDRQAGSARIRYPNGNELRVAEVSCGGARSGVVRGLYFSADGAMWVGDLTVSRDVLDADPAGQGVWRFAGGNFVVSDRTNPNGYWRAVGSPSGQMLVTVEQAGLFLAEQLPLAGRTTAVTAAAPWVRTRWILPGIGYFEGMTDYFNGFRFDGVGALDQAQPGSPYVTGGEPYHGSFTAIDGSYRITGQMIWRGGNNVPWLDRFAISVASPGFGTPYEGGMVFEPDRFNPVRIETRVATVLGPPGLYRAYNRVIPGRLEPVLAAPEGAAPPPGASAEIVGTVDWTPSLLNLHFTDLIATANRVYWREVFRQSNAARQTAYNEQAEAQRIHGERAHRREQRQAENRAIFAAAMGDVMADLSDQANRSVYDMHRSAVINQQAVDAASGQGVVGAAPPMTYDQWTAYQQASVAAPPAPSADLAAPGSASPPTNSARRGSATPSDEASGEEPALMTLDEARQLMSGLFTQSDGLTFFLHPTHVQISRPAPIPYQRHDAFMDAVSNMEVTDFDAAPSWARVLGTGTCRSYQGHHEDGTRDLNTVEPCRWTFLVHIRDRKLRFGAAAAQIDNGERDW